MFKKLNQSVIVSLFITAIFLIFSIYFFLRSYEALGAWQNFNLFDDYIKLVVKGGQGDEASYMKQADKWYSEGISKNNSGILGLWPPGLMLMHLAGIKLFGNNYMPLVIFGSINIIFMSTSVYFLSRFIIFKWNSLKYVNKLIICVGFLYFNYEWHAFFLKNSILLTEGLSTAFFSLYISYLIYSFFYKSENIKSKKYFTLFQILFLSFLLIAAQYTRQIYSLVIDLAFFSFIIFLIYLKIKSKVTLISYIGKHKIILIPIIVAFLASLPYKMLQFYSTNSFAMTATTSYVWGQRWIPSEYLISQGGAWLVEGGANLPCNLNHQLCQEIFEKELKTNFPYQNSEFFKDYKKFTFQTIAEKPLEWINYKIKLFIKYWCAGSKDIATPATFNEYKLIVLLAILFIFISLLMKLLFSTQLVQLISILSVCLIVSLLLPQFLLHFEARYFQPLKIFTLHLILISFFVKEEQVSFK